MLIIKNILSRKGLSLVGGKIKTIAEGTGLAAGKVVNITLTDGTQIAFWDNETRQMASRLRLAKPKVGSFISVLAMFKDKDERKANAINFKYNGVWSFAENTASLKPTNEGNIVDVADVGGETRVTLDNRSVVSFKNLEKGYRFQDRLKELGPIVGKKLAIVENGGKMTNFAIDGVWNIKKTIHAVIGNAAFIDESIAPDGSPRVKVNVSIFDHKEPDGTNIYRNCYCYFDNNNSPNMVESVKEKVRQHSPIAIVGNKNPKTEKETYTGFYFINL